MEKDNERPQKRSWHKSLYSWQIVKSRMKWAGRMVRMRDERLPKTSGKKRSKKDAEMRKTTDKMGGLCEETSEKGRGGRKVVRKGQQQGPVEKITKVAVQRSHN